MGPNFEIIYYDNSNFHFLSKEVLNTILNKINETDNYAVLFDIFENELKRIELQEKIEDKRGKIPNTFKINSDPWFELSSREEIKDKILKFKNHLDQVNASFLYPKELFKNDIQDLINGYNPSYFKVNCFNLFYEDDANYNISTIKIYGRDRIEIISKSVIIVNFDELKELVYQGKLISNIKSGANYIEFANFESERPHSKIRVFNRDRIYFAQELEDLKMIEDIINYYFEGKESLRTKCLNAYNEYTKNPTTLNKHKLLLAYESMPVHERRWLSDQGADEEPLRNLFL